MDISIRTEQEKDHRRVEEVTRAAFSYPERIERGGIGCPYEHWMVHELRRRDGIPELSLVAEVDNIVIGHIICSKAEVRTFDSIIPVLNFGPLSVLPEYQRKGVGKALIKSMICKAAELGFGAILFFGRPEYYPQFGFKEASAWQITDSDGIVIRHLWEWNSFLVIYHMQRGGNIMNRIFMMIALIVIK